MFPGLSITQKQMAFSSNEFIHSDSEDDHYEEVEDCAALEDGIILNQDIDDEYEDFEDEMENDIPEPADSDNIEHSSIIDEEEAEHYDSFEDDE